ncbi:MAG: FtsX-like permease family protein [Cyclobacteriaceae bacterium]
MKPKTPIPPRYAEKLLTWFLREELAEEVLGDLDEKFYSTIEKKSIKRARLNYWYQVFNYIRPFAVTKTRLINSNTFDMYRNYFKIGYRNLLKNKGYSAINIVGLAMGMTVAIFIGLWIQDELSFNKHHANYDRIVQVMQHQSYEGYKTTERSIPFPLGPVLKDEYGSDFKHQVMASWTFDHILAKDNKAFSVSGNFIEPAIIPMLTLKLKEGDLSALNSLNSIILSETIAKSLFGETDPMGQIIRIDNELTVSVTGIYEDIPINSKFKNLQFIAPFDLYVSSREWVQNARNKWGNNSFQIFAQVADNVDIPDLSRKIRNVKLEHAPEEAAFSPELFLHQMKDWRLNSNWVNGVNSGGRMQYVWLFGLVGVFVLILACINFMNLTTARSEKRAKEVGIRKSIGSLRSQLIGQFYSESFLVVSLAFVCALLFALLIIPYFNQMVEKQMVLPVNQPIFWLISMVFILSTGFVAGSYPALYLSSFDAVKVLKGTFKAGKSASSFRRLLIIIQLTVSLILIISTLMVERQINHTLNRPLSYSQDGLISLSTSSPSYYEKYDVLREELIRTKAISNMALSSSPLTRVNSTNSGLKWSEDETDINKEFATIRVSTDYGKTINWEVLEGREFSKDFATDNRSLIFNETAIKYMGLTDPISHPIKWNESDFKIIGVVKDMVMESPFNAVNPTVFVFDDGEDAFTTIFKLNPEKSANESLLVIEKVFEEIVPMVPFDYSFIDEKHARKFANERLTAKLTGIFSGLTILINCLGLIGLTSFLAEQRTKEIGVRKVLGATISNIWRLLSREFFFLVILSCIVAMPLAYYFISNWLDAYEYRTNIPLWLFIATCGGVFLITILTTSFQSIRAAKMNPVKSLRSE